MPFAFEPAVMPPGCQAAIFTYLDGDGDYEIVLLQASRGRDNSQAGFTGSSILQA